ncbi:hypothetical protein ANN_19606 [Periplaneta americana]|uniref:Reverse transcriptase domain-containing protein n=1 Tax=Periplaneta americana TaxID=6978 RepID=A0ABQ8SAK3_PERAM|nr:hypothetical protein ANN_19606 [Periplaneta americana]
MAQVVFVNSILTAGPYCLSADRAGPILRRVRDKPQGPEIEALPISARLNLSLNQSQPSFRRIDRLSSNPRGGRLAAYFPNSKNPVEGHPGLWQDCGNCAMLGRGDRMELSEKVTNRNAADDFSLEESRYDLGANKRIVCKIFTVYFDYYLYHFNLTIKLWTTQHYEENLHVDKDTSVPVSDIDLIEYEEMEQILQSFSNNKSPGSDDLNIELLKYAPVGIKQRLLNILNICWITYKIPEEWTKAIVIPIYKKGDRGNPNNYRGISLLNSTYKLYAKIITRRLNTISETKLDEIQCGFRKGRSCADCVFVMQQIIQKRREFNLLHT